MLNYILKRGLNVPTISVFDQAGNVIEDQQRRVFRHVIQNGFGADVVFANGTTGEWNRLANPQRQRLLEIAVDEVQTINTELFTQGRQPVEAWCGINGDTKAEVLANLDLAIQLNADAAVIAPLAIRDLPEAEIVPFFLREMNDLLERAAHPIPVFLYDNADINAPGHKPDTHIRTQTVKALSRLPWVYGIKVSASRAVLGNYTKAALHFKQPGEWGIYVGNANLIFEFYRPTGRLRAGWNEFLLHNALPIGVISGPGNVLPREWQKAWRVCWAGDEELVNLYQEVCGQFEALCQFPDGGKLLACFKAALKIDDVIESDLVGAGTAALTTEQQRQFADGYAKFKTEQLPRLAELWRTRMN